MSRPPSRGRRRVQYITTTPAQKSGSDTGPSRCAGPRRTAPAPQPQGRAESGGTVSHRRGRSRMGRAGSRLEGQAPGLPPGDLRPAARICPLVLPKVDETGPPTGGRPRRSTAAGRAAACGEPRIGDRKIGAGRGRRRHACGCRVKFLLYSM